MFITLRVSSSTVDYQKHGVSRMLLPLTVNTTKEDWLCVLLATRRDGCPISW